MIRDLAGRRNPNGQTQLPVAGRATEDPDFGIAVDGLGAFQAHFGRAVASRASMESGSKRRSRLVMAKSLKPLLRYVGYGAGATVSKTESRP